jgi:hypothetical protein
VHCIDDKPNGIIVNFNSDWSGEVRIAWYVASERHDPGPTPPSLRECWCNGRDLVAGLFTPVSVANEPPPGAVVVTEPPTNVLTRAVALAVETYLCRKMEAALGDICIRRGKL